MTRTPKLAPPIALGLAALLAALPAADALAQKKKKSSLTSGARSRTEADDLAEKKALEAQKRREERAPTVVEEKKREQVKVEEGPKLKAQDFRKDLEFQVAEKRKELIEYLDRILDQNPSDAERPELLFQKAELFQEESQYRFFQAMALDDKIYAAEDKKQKRKVRRLKKTKDKKLKSSRQWVRDAVLLYQEIDESYPGFERMPEVLYSLGQAFWSAQSYKNALPVYRKLIKNHPKSQYVSDSYLAFGEYYFELAEEPERDLNKALAAYQKAAENQDSPVFGYAVYKQGWCFYNLGRFDKAADKFKEVIFYSDLNADLLGEKRITLAKEARKDFILAYAQYGDARRALDEFKAIAPDENDQKMLLEKLGNIWYGDGKDRNAIIIYQLLMKLAPENTRNPLFQAKVVKLASRIGKKRQVVGQARKLVEEYRRVRDVFDKIEKDDPTKNKVGEDLQAADDVADNTLRYLATTWHNEAKKTLDDGTFQYALELYGDYLELFPERKTSYEIRFFYAELLFRLEKFEQAGEQYVMVFKRKPEGKWAEASAEEAVRAFDEVVKDYNREHKMKFRTGKDALKPIPLPDVKKKYIGACNNYVDNYPKGEIALEAQYKVARTLYDHNYFKESTPRFMKIIDDYGGSPRANQSANLVLDTYNVLEDWEKLHDAARKFSRDRSLMKEKEFKELVAKVLEESAFKLIGAYEAKKQWVEAGSRYLAFADEFKESPLADKALANAAAMFTRAGQLDRAIKVRIRLVDDFPDSPLIADQMFAIASSYEQVVSYKQAADYLERFVEKFKDDPRAKDALFNASIYRQGVGQTRRAIADRERYLKLYPKADDAEDIAWSIPVAWEQAGRTSQAKDAYLDFAKTWWKRNAARALRAQYKAVRMLEERRRWRREFDKELKVLNGMAKNFKRKGKDLEEAADPLGYLAFREAGLVLERYRELDIAKPDDPKKFRKTLEEKKKAKDATYAAFTKVVKLKSPEFAVASLYEIGKAHQHLAKAIQAVPPPRGLNDEQQMLFRDKLTEQTLPIEDQAGQAMELCLDESARFGVFNKWTRRCLAYLEETRPQQFPKNEREAREPLAVTHQQVEAGHGLVFSLPKKGDRPEAVSGTEPPPPPPAPPPTMAFDDDDLQAGGDS